MRQGLPFTVYSFIMLFICGILPLLGILVLNLIILCAIKSSKKNKKQAKKHVSQKKRRLATKHLQGESPAAQADVSTIPAARIKSGTDHVHNENDVNINIAGDNKKANQEKQLTIMTVVMTTAFFFCITPYYARALFLVIDMPKSITRRWINVLARILILLNSAINFFIYVMTGSKFRSDLVTFFSIKR